jgi:hypothetical protein
LACLADGYAEILRGTMVARQIVDKLLTLPAVLPRHAQALDNPAESSTKRKRLASSECSARFSVRIARHEKLPK